MNLPPRGYRCPKCGSPNPSTPHVHPTSLVVERREDHPHRRATDTVEGVLLICTGQPEAGTWVPEFP